MICCKLHHTLNIDKSRFLLRQIKIFPHPQSTKDQWWRLSPARCCATSCMHSGLRVHIAGNWIQEVNLIHIFFPASLFSKQTRVLVCCNTFSIAQLTEIRVRFLQLLDESIKRSRIRQNTTSSENTVRCWYSITAVWNTVLDYVRKRARLGPEEHIFNTNELWQSYLLYLNKNRVYQKREKHAEIDLTSLCLIFSPP